MKTRRTQTVVAYWLIPAEPERELFAEIIRILAKQFDAPRFEPHVTLFAVSPDRQSAAKVLHQISASPIRLRIRDVSYSTKFTETLFLRFKSNKALQKLVVDLARVMKSRPRAVCAPHISFLYKKLPTATKKVLAATIKLPFREVVFDSIKAVRCALPTRTRAEVKAWCVIASNRLR